MKPSLERLRLPALALLGAVLLGLVFLRAAPDAPTTTTPPAAGFGPGWTWFTLAALGLGWWLLRRRRPVTGEAGRVAAVARLPLDRQGVLHLVEVDGCRFLLAQGGDGLRLLARLEDGPEGGERE